MSSYQRIYAVVRCIPSGRVATYGQVAVLAGLAGARQVGYALHALTESGVPWHRVINARGEISRRSQPGADRRQRRLLEREGVSFDERGRVALSRFQWTPDGGDEQRALRARASPSARARGRGRRSTPSGRDP